MNDRPITYDELREAVRNEVIQQMTPVRLTLDRVDDDMRMVKDTLYGNTVTRQPGIVATIDKIQTTLNSLLEAQSKRTWLLYGIAAGLGLQLANTFGLLQAIARAVAGI